jgi:hypothetical protein
MADTLLPSKFDLLVKQNELTPKVASQLKEILSTCEIVLLCDDSGSMKQSIAEPNSNRTTTRWLELKKLASVIIEFVTAINPNGLDIWFFHRPTLRNVIDMNGLRETFENLPDGDTPLITTLKKIFRDKANLPSGKQLLVVVITDGVPSDGEHYDLHNVLMNKGSNVHVSFAECTDNEEDMDYLDRWDGKIPNFDNTEDYREELQKIRNLQGPDFKFDYNDYVIKILLATFVRWYFKLDQITMTKQRTVIQGSQQKWQPPPQAQPYKARRGGCVIL